MSRHGARALILTTDEQFMRIALRLARRNLGRAWPNPAVGAVLVAPGDGAAADIVGLGATAAGGRPHAERIAVDMAGERARGATCYVTLEPCAHHGRTPPCSDALIEAGVGRVVVGIGDPDPRVGGQGIAALRAHGIAVTCGVMAQDAALLNGGHILRVREGRPFVTLKLALTADGFIAGANHGQIAITGEETRAYVHMMRARHDAILVGRGTVAADDPDLTCRLPGMAELSPLRVVLDSGHAMAPEAAMLRDGPPVWVIGAQDCAKAAALEAAGARILPVAAPGGRPAVAAVLQRLAAEGITRLMVEGGGEVAGSFLSSGLVDEIVLARAPRRLAAIAPQAGPGYGVVLPHEDAAAGGYEQNDRFACGGDEITVLRRRGLCAHLVALSGMDEVRSLKAESG
ncbi:MAG: bifunctional diaminohydroxyphosphoribosylaminopyrimidine deaminase/5-amino-6-(5-phosphoribosylamino)uracil reductase RibD [Rhodobiaceae bacterium]|nr:bifunctional diaminohydroxyphosphoribosylaminopyrimidine deaminase/5-amino-6-(5-phosphoribosylamino)uracil reductase RibD [Rhodobiaceae bacterium]MCC0052639.1 bifunctional diaminohydroxyphosphoribosylaminopyrimidine deaminase/5-amino-6-(5-phosphoribosylamino)uracil reductase RibD [Rhodobiaceae bacterium]